MRMTWMQSIWVFACVHLWTKWGDKLGKNFLVSHCTSWSCWSNFIWNGEVFFGNWLTVQNSSAWSLLSITWWKIQCPRLLSRDRGQKQFLLKVKKKCGKTAFWVKRIQFNFGTQSCICWVLALHWGGEKNIGICRLLALTPKLLFKRGRVENFCCIKKTEKAKRIKEEFHTENINLGLLEFMRIWRTLIDAQCIYLRSTQVCCLMVRWMLSTRKKFAIATEAWNSGMLISRLESTVCDLLWRVFIQRLVWLENSQIIRYASALQWGCTKRVWMNKPSNSSLATNLIQSDFTREALTKFWRMRATLCWVQKICLQLPLFQSPLLKSLTLISTRFLTWNQQQKLWTTICLFRIQHTRGHVNFQIPSVNKSAKFCAK